MDIQPIAKTDSNLGGPDYFILWAGVAIAPAAWAAGCAAFQFIAVKQYAVGGSIPSMLVSGLIYILFTKKPAVPSAG